MTPLLLLLLLLLSEQFAPPPPPTHLNEARPPEPVSTEGRPERSSYVPLKTILPEVQ